MSVKTAIEFPKEAKTAPRGYSQYCLEAAFYERLGWTYKDLDTRPRKQVSDYKTIIMLAVAHEKVEADRARAGKG